MEKIKLNVVGISYSQTQTGAYTMILETDSGKMRLPIVIGSFEAQSIAIELENMKPIRPLTHDLFKIFAEKFGISIEEVVIYRISEGVFYSKLICDDGKELREIDSRTSDAIAIALRVKCPIYTFQSIIEEIGIPVELEPETPKQPTTKSPIKTPEYQGSGYEQNTIEELEEMLKSAVEEEAYEKASLIRDELSKRKKRQ
jgi:uncharacterized protein